MSELENLLWLQMRAFRLAKPEREYRFAPPRRWRFDFSWPDLKIAVEVDGGTWVRGRHNRGSGIESDAEKYSTAAALGWRVLRFTRAMVEDGRAIQLIEQALEAK